MYFWWWIRPAGTLAKRSRVPEGIHLEFLPSGSPELQPAERLWPLTNEGVANGLFEEIEQIEQALMERCMQLLDQTESIRASQLPLVASGGMMLKNSSAGFGISCAYAS